MSFSKLILSLLVTISFWSCTENQETTQLDFSVKVAGATSKKAFAATVHPLLVKHCSTCHGDGGSAIRHASSDSEEAHDVVVDGGKVNFASPASSRLVDKMLTQKHNCWGGDCVSASNEMLAAIEKWIEMRGVSAGEIGANRTRALKYADAEVRVPETINGTVVLQAEDGELVGRFKPKVSSTASNFSYIAGDLAPVHPLEQTDRAAVINEGLNRGQGCAPVTTAQLADTTTGRYRISERERHYNSQGHRYYSQRIRFRIIRPDRRADYLAQIEAGNTSLADLQGFFLTEDAPDDDGVYQGDIIQAGEGSLRVLPDVLSHTVYEASVREQQVPAYQNFFAPRFINGTDPGDGSGSDYYLPTNDEIRAALPDNVKRDIVWKIVNDSFRDYYFEDDGDPEPTRDVPYFLRFGGATTYDETTGTANTLLSNYFSLTQNNALNNIATQGGTVHQIDQYVHYYVDANDRDFNNFSWTWDHDNNAGTADVTQTFIINNGTQRLDLSSLFVESGNIDVRQIQADNYAGTLRTVLRNNCIECHGTGAPRNRHSADNVLESYDAAIGLINFNEAAASRVASRMDERHNCGDVASCQNIKTQIVSAIEAWKTQNTNDIEAANANNQPRALPLSDKERTVGRARYTFKVNEAGAYSFWLKAMTANGKDLVRVRLLDQAGRPIDMCDADTSCPQRESEYDGRSAQAIQEMHCDDYDLPNDFDVWTWWTRSVNDLDNRRKWDLAEGTYTLEIIEQDIDTKIDMIAISKNPEFNPAENLIDEGLILSARPRILKYDISNLIGSPGFFEIEIVEENGGDSYVFRNPQFVGLTQNLKVSDLKLLVNDTYEFANSSFTKIDAVVGSDPRILTSTSLVALSIQGTGNDTFTFAFGDLRTTAAGLTKEEDDVPVAVEGRECLNLPLFESTVMPILNRFRLVLKYTDGYQDYTSNTSDFPGTNRNAGANPTFYTCTTCHNEQHPYFKMTTFFDNSEVLCAQALSRVDFSNFEKSLLLRGINGTFNHPKLHFAERVELTGSGTGRRFRTNANKVNGFESSWLGLRWEKYVRDNGSNTGQPGVITIPGGASAEDRLYLEKFIGQYQRARYVRIDDPFARRDGNIRLVNIDNNGVQTDLDIAPVGPVDPQNPDRWTYAENGMNKYEIIDPVDYLARKGDLVPEQVGDGGQLVVRPDCFGDDFPENNGIFQDSCNNNVNAASEFETIKTMYREAVINWMREEKRSYDNQ